MKTRLTSFAAARRAAMLALPVLLLASPSTQARPYGGSPGPMWDGPGWPGSYDAYQRPSRTHDPREGQVDVSRFVLDSPAAEVLGHGAVRVSSESGPEGTSWLEPGQRAAYEAAVVDALVGAGYDTQHPDSAEAQVVSLTISRRVLVPAEEKKSPVSGSAAMSVGTRGSAYGLAVNVDLTKPRPALVSTRLDMRIRAHADGPVLWEGHAEIATREDDDWSEGRIAEKLVGALLDRFPDAQPVSVGLEAPAAPPPAAPPGD